MCWQALHMFYRCMERSNKPETQSIYRNSVHPSPRAPNLVMWEQIWWRLLQNNDAIIRLLYVVTWKTKGHGYVSTQLACFWVHAQYLTSMVCDQYTGILFSQASEHPICGNRFGDNCKTTQPSSGSIILLDNWRTTRHGCVAKHSTCLSMHGEGITILEHNQYTGILFIQAT